MSQSKKLVVYYSWSSNTARVAQQVAKTAGADIFELNVVEPFPSDMFATSDVATKQYQSGNLPELKRQPDLTGYDQVLVGGPVWSGKLATPVATYLANTDFGNRVVAAFCTSSGSFDTYQADFSRQVKNGDVRAGLLLGGSRANDEQINRWLNQLK